jgi:hypothetical protein
MCASSSGRAEAFFSASGQGLSQETAEREVKVRPAGAKERILIWLMLGALSEARSSL